MNQLRFKTRITQIPIVAGSNQPYDIPRQYDYESLYLRLSGSVQVTAAATSVRAEAPSQILPRVEITSEGRNTHFNAPFWRAGIGNFERPSNIGGSLQLVPPSSPALGTYPFSAHGVIDFCNVDGIRPKDSNLRTSALSLFQIRPTFGNPGDMFVGGTAVFAGTPILEVFSITMYEIPGADGRSSTPGALKKTVYQEVAVPTSNLTQEIRLPTGNYLKSVLIRTEGLVTAGEPSNGVLNEMVLSSAQDVRMKLLANQVRVLNAQDYGPIPVGFYVLDFTSQGKIPGNLTDCWNVAGQAEPKLILDVNGGANVRIQIVTTEMILATPM
jgi:hypothetical protein